jgi:rhamnogalacturonan endolyase
VLVDAATGKVLWGLNQIADVGRGMAADIDSTHRGYEMWSATSGGVYDVKGTKISSNVPTDNFRVYWDGDLYDEILDGGKIDKWTGNGTIRLATLAGSACNSTKNTPNLSADILGDWREEVILHDASHLFIYTTTIPTPFRLYTLMHDPVYRAAIAWQNSAYNQPPHLGFWLGAGVDKAPRPDIYYPGSAQIEDRPSSISTVYCQKAFVSGNHMALPGFHAPGTAFEVRDLAGRREAWGVAAADGIDLDRSLAPGLRLVMQETR